MDLQTFKSLYITEKVALLDVREADEYEKGHIEGAINTPLSQLTVQIAQLDKKQTYYLICKAGVRAQKAHQVLSEHGFKSVALTDGMDNW